ncbi:DEAD/DEAH box helicase [Acuticoccus mangrovi]|uniref:DEAD/DEAH box helicase n=1 Tax=Acuticoccus mangrovi TaxID=2796142 RepID=A0A934MKB0_9HYPH|nr:DEAD/DEAH box helicase [Acuticoccus mangrovi]MBJ3775304.1 DEAD/DEAH box helicase [Acuticoccus mangrovi]
MTACLVSKAVDGGFVIAAEETARGLLRRATRRLATSEWAAHGLPATSAGRIALRALLADDLAEMRDNDVLIHDRGAARLDVGEADALGLPQTLPFTLEIATRDNIASDRFRAVARFVDPSGGIVRIERRGASARVGARLFRVPESVGRVIDAAEAINHAHDADQRLAAIAALKALLPDEANIKPDTFLKRIRLHHAHTMLLDVRTVDGEVEFDPVLLSEWKEGGEPSPLLGDAEQERFRSTFRGRGVMPAFVLGNGEYVFVDPALRRALGVVHEKQRAPNAERVDFVQRPERVLADAGALPEPDGEDTEPPRFVETATYSERVREIGPWVPPELPFIKSVPNNWLPERFAILLGDKLVTLEAQGVPPALAAVQKARADGASTAQVGDVEVPATADVERTLAGLDAVSRPPDRDEPTSSEKKGQSDTAGDTDHIRSGPHAPVILTNYTEIDHLREARAREMNDATPSLRSELRPHQVEALAWLCECYTAGRPGALLADDMGLGKTIEVLAFLSWWRAASTAPRPILIVAPTSLLDNWTREHATHLATPLGPQLTAYGPGIKLLRTRTGKEEATGTGHLNIEAIASAGFVLTTYETLRDFAISFAAIPFGIAVYDETQKAKNPKSRLTNAVKAINADFSIAMTGTPVENHMADLWSICDLIQPGVLGTLRDFVDRYDPSLEDLTPFCELRTALLERDDEGLPPLVLRRLKTDVVDLPPLIPHPVEREMAGRQAEAYQHVVARARAEGGREQLRVLHDMRSISLHPVDRSNEPDLSDEAYISLSARLAETVSILDDVQREGAKALVFLDARRMQDVLSDLLAQRYRIPAPDIISGETPARRRQEIVDRFSAAEGFCVLILSPRAAGVGLNITAATHVIHLDRWWNPAVEDQCTARAYRIGQTRPVTVHLPMALHPGFGAASYDRVLHGILTRKRKMSQTLFMPAEISASEFGDIAGSATDDDGFSEGAS